MMKKISVCQIVDEILGWLAIHWFKSNVDFSGLNIKQLDRARIVGVVVVDKDH